PLAWTPAGGVDLSVPLEDTLEVSMPSLAFTRALAGDAWRFDGALQARLALGGTLGRPDFTGRIDGTGLVAEQRELGMKLTDGVLRATLRERTVDIDTMRFASGAGSVTMTGTLRPDDRSEAVLTLDRMPIPLGAGQRLLLSGEARATLRGGRLGIRGALRADEGVIELTSQNAPELSSDVVVVRDAAESAARRRERLAARSAPPAERADAEPPDTKGFRIFSDLQIDLGDRFRVFGAGVDARLEGQLTLRGRLPDSPRLTGTVKIAQGTYTGFGQKLEIERGTLVFSGPVDNPAIDIVAYRRYLPVEAGVALTGTARVPRLALVSRPDVSEQDKLSWLVLGTGSDTARNGGQNSALQAAAATLLATADPRFAGPSLASTFGLDVLSIRTAQVGSIGGSGSSSTSAQDSVVTLGKRLSQRLFVSYEQSLRGLENLLRLQYEITERLSVRGRAGTQNGIDLLWTYRYD
ncbi:MAG: translocation/assembly module TamB domain-containing protein, partial [Burkholderiaceae bacterium]